MYCYITLKMVEDGLMSKAIIPFIDKNNNLKVTIGDYCFNAKNNCTAIPNTFALAIDIHYVLTSFYFMDEYFAEYMYYYKYLCKHI